MARAGPGGAGDVGRCSCPQAQRCPQRANPAAVQRGSPSGFDSDLRPPAAPRSLAGAVRSRWPLSGRGPADPPASERSARQLAAQLDPGTRRPVSQVYAAGGPDGYPPSGAGLRLQDRHPGSDHDAEPGPSWWYQPHHRWSAGRSATHSHNGSGSGGLRTAQPGRSSNQGQSRQPALRLWGWRAPRGDDDALGCCQSERRPGAGGVVGGCRRGPGRLTLRYLVSSVLSPL